MAGLQRSATTFRRSGSSGLVWDERFLTENADAKGAAGDGAEEPQPELWHSRSVGSIGMMRRVADSAGDKKAKQKQKQKKKAGQKEKEKEEERTHQVFRTKDVAPDLDPPSPRVSGCILCSIFHGSSHRSAAAPRAKPRRK
ncbi:hypothetical protein GUJ93_ZPchr0006g41581 [Zizania palustris]|uniref:Uncharacterized protein n=1 Tax=Zizania palustris TaxID=103762 RepID=A0A8J5W397_ZIZPA|nr:hypothetical protein GUJ93_ZPchr0006g41581 [Zizania palustris]